MVDGDVAVRNRSRSNGVFAVAATPGPAYVVKHLAFAGLPGGGSGRAERTVYERAEAVRTSARQPPLPRLVGVLGDLLVLERAGDGETLDERLRDPERAAAAARLLGRALGRWRRAAGSFARLRLPRRLPWVFSSLDEAPPEALVASEPALRLASSLRRRHVLRDGLTGLRRAWRPDTVVHGDVRWDNAVVALAAGGVEHALLVDWELAGHGDRGWDLAGAAADVVAGDVLAGSAFGGARGAAVLGELAAGYREGLPAGVAGADLAGAVRLLPARLLQVAFLHAAWGGADGSEAAGALAAAAADLLVDPRPVADALGAGARTRP